MERKKLFYLIALVVLVSAAFIVLVNKEAIFSSSSEGLDKTKTDETLSLGRSIQANETLDKDKVAASSIQGVATADESMQTSNATAETKKEVGPAPALISQYLLPIILLALGLIAAVGFFQMQMQKPEFEIGAEVYKVLSSETRVKILKELSNGDKIGAYLARTLGKDRSTISEHMNVLVQLGLVERLEKEGRKWVFYKLTRKGRLVLRNIPT